jgi:hypothetical protein
MKKTLGHIISTIWLVMMLISYTGFGDVIKGPANIVFKNDIDVPRGEATDFVVRFHKEDKWHHKYMNASHLKIEHGETVIYQLTIEPNGFEEFSYSRENRQDTYHRPMIYTQSDQIDAGWAKEVSDHPIVKPIRQVVVFTKTRDGYYTISHGDYLHNSVFFMVQVLKDSGMIDFEPLERTRDEIAVLDDDDLSDVHLSMRRCDGCGISGSDEMLQQCGKCGKVSYCSKPCQLADWKARHKKACRKLRPTGKRLPAAKAKEGESAPAKESGPTEDAPL